MLDNGPLENRAWNHMSKLLDKEMPFKRKRRLIFWWWIPLVVLISLGLGFWLHSFQNSYRKTDSIIPKSTDQAVAEKSNHETLLNENENEKASILPDNYQTEGKKLDELTTKGNNRTSFKKYYQKHIPFGKDQAKTSSTKQDIYRSDKIHQTDDLYFEKSRNENKSVVLLTENSRPISDDLQMLASLSAAPLPWELFTQNPQNILIEVPDLYKKAVPNQSVNKFSNSLGLIGAYTPAINQFSSGIGWSLAYQWSSKWNVSINPSLEFSSGNYFVTPNANIISSYEVLDSLRAADTKLNVVNAGGSYTSNQGEITFRNKTKLLTALNLSMSVNYEIFPKLSVQLGAGGLFQMNQNLFKENSPSYVLKITDQNYYSWKNDKIKIEFNAGLKYNVSKKWSILLDYRQFITSNTKTEAIAKFEAISGPAKLNIIKNQYTLKLAYRL
ncbi:MAG: hypothetical protein M3Q56_02945 [Bacteroidota bacterium]|nr:hypothetical protein [Bacteroidota bacterium]